MSDFPFVSNDSGEFSGPFIEGDATLNRVLMLIIDSLGAFLRMTDYGLGNRLGNAKSGEPSPHRDAKVMNPERLDLAA